MDGVWLAGKVPRRKTALSLLSPLESRVLQTPESQVAADFNLYVRANGRPGGDERGLLRGTGGTMGASRSGSCPSQASGEQWQLIGRHRGGRRQRAEPLADQRFLERRSCEALKDMDTTVGIMSFTSGASEQLAGPSWIRSLLPRQPNLHTLLALYIVGQRRNPATANESAVRRCFELAGRPPL